MSKGTKTITWRVCGEDRRDREGVVAGTTLTVQVHYSYATRKHTIRFAGYSKGDFVDLEAAKKFAEMNVGTWLEEHAQAAAEAAKRREDERLEHLAMTSRLESLVSSLANYGIAARAMGGVFMRIDVAEALVSKLENYQKIEEDLRRIEESGCV